jgi:uncharacterized membrane protein (UPF0182 family)
MKMNDLRGGRLLIVLVAIVLALLLLGRATSSAYVEILWFDAVGYSSVFWRRILWEWGIRLAGAVVVAIAIFVNFRIVARTLGGLRIKRRVGDLVISEQLPETYVFWGIILIAALMGAWFGASIPRAMGLQVLFLLKAPVWGLVDPILGKDMTFYVIPLPVLGALVTFGMVVVFLLFTLASAGYAATGALQWGRGRIDIEDQPRAHLTVIVAAFFVLMAIRFWLGRYLLLLDGTSGVQSIFGYADAEARLSALRILAVLSAFAGIGTLWGGLKARLLPAAAAVGALVVGGVVVGQAYPSFVQRFRVEPNELDRETPFIEHNIHFTRVGFDLTELERREFQYEQEVEVDWQAAAAQFNGLPVWSSQALLTTFRELEARFPYYDFSSVTVDRYETPQGPVPVAVSVREILPRGIQDPNWQNLHLRDLYIRGMGAVVSAAGSRTPQGRPPMFVSGIPPEFSEGGVAPESLRLTRPEVYVGTRRQSFAIVDPAQQTAPDGSPARPGIDFPKGIELSSPLRTLALAWQARDANLLFASEVTSTSRFLFRRDVLDRVFRISGPLLRYPDEPYPVVHDGHVVWILEGFTGTRWFPLSTTHNLEAGRPVRYARNSVKVIVDGVTGEVTFYVADDSDQLLQAYRQGFPTLFRPIDEMPTNLRNHVRYSRTMLDLQARVLNRYHQESAPVFHGQQDVWELPQELAQGTTPVPYRADYGIYRLPGEAEEGFLLTSVFVPRGRQNLTAILTARSDPERYGELVLFDVRVEDQAPGPRQVEALIEQDPVISQQFSLWRTGGSQVWTGHLHLVPVGGTLLYMEPVFLAAEADAIPELRRFVVSDGRRVAMEETLPEAIQALASMSGDAPPDLESILQPALTDASVSPLDRSQWPAEALALLEGAEAALRAGDFEGFGDALDQLKALLQGLSTVP